MKTFSYKEHEECCFAVNHYFTNNLILTIDIKDLQTNEIIKSTIFITDFDSHYVENKVRVENYSVNREIVEFLKELEIVSEIVVRYVDVETEKKSLISDICRINLDVLKDYTSEWNYKEID